MAFLAALGSGVFLAALAAWTARGWRGPGDGRLLGAFLALVALNQVIDAISYAAAAAGMPASPFRHLALLPVLADPAVLLAYAWSLRGPVRSSLVVAAALPLPLGYLLAPPAAPYLSSWRLVPVYVVALAVAYAWAFVVVVDTGARGRNALARQRARHVGTALGVALLPRIALLGVDAGVAGPPLGMPGATARLCLLLAAVAVAAAACVLRAHRLAPREGLAAYGSLWSLLLLIGVLWMLSAVPFLTRMALPWIYAARWFLFGGLLLRPGGQAGLLRADGAARLRDVFHVGLAAAATGTLGSALAEVPGATASTAFVGAAGVVLLVVLARRLVAPAGPSESAWRPEALARAHLLTHGPNVPMRDLQARYGLTRTAARRLGALVEAERGTAPVEEVGPPGHAFLGRYEVERLLGAGGQGVAWSAWDRARARPVVLKVVTDDEASSREVDALIDLDDPHLVRLLGIERAREGTVLVLDRVQGETLRARLARGPLSPADVTRVARDVLSGLATLHAAGLVHGDVKPENVVLRHDGRAVLVDLGASRRARRVTVRRAPTTTPGYTSPEVAAGQAPDARADVYAVGVLIWEALTARMPPQGTVPPAWAPLLAQALAPSPDARPASAEAFRRALPGR